MNIIDAKQNEESTNIAFYLRDGDIPLATNGPLAAAMTGALDKIYKREIDPATGIVLETQQMDSIKMIKTWAERAKLIADEQGKAPAMIYGVDEAQASPTDIIDVSDVIWRMEPAERANSVVIVEDGENSVNPSVVALEALCVKHGIGFYRSFTSYVNQG